MSKIVATSVIRGARDIFQQASNFLDKAIKEKGPEQKIGFPEITRISLSKIKKDSLATSTRVLK